MKHLKYLSLGSATHQLQQLILGLLIKQTPDRNTAYLPSIFRIHTSSSSKNISGPSRFSMSLKPLQGTYEEDRHTEASVRSSHAVVSHTRKLQAKLFTSKEVVTPLPHYLAPPTH